MSWSQIDANTVRAISASGQPVWVCLPRWTNDNPEGVFRVQPVGGELSDFRLVQGFRIRFHVDGGKFFGTPEYFRFYRARVLSVRVL